MVHTGEDYRFNSSLLQQFFTPSEDPQRVCFQISFEVDFFVEGTESLSVTISSSDDAAIVNQGDSTSEIRILDGNAGKIIALLKS